MAIAFELYPVQTRRLHPLSRVSVVIDNAGDIPILDHLGEGAVAGFTGRACGHHRQPVALVPAGPAAKVGQLDHHCRPGLVAVIGQPLHPGHHLILVGEYVVENRRRVFRHGSRPSRHRQRDTCLCPLQMVQPVAILRHPVLGIGGFVAGGHDPVAQRQVPQLVGLEEGIMQHCRALDWGFPGKASRAWDPAQVELTHMSSFAAWPCRTA